MKDHASLALLVGILITGLMAPDTVLAQSSTPPSAQSKGTEGMVDRARERRNALEEEAAKRKQRNEAQAKKSIEMMRARSEKRAACKKEAAGKKLSFFERRRFVRNCTAR